MYDLGINPNTAVYNSIYQQIFHKGNQLLNETIPGLISEYSGVRWNPLKKINYEYIFKSGYATTTNKHI